MIRTLVVVLKHRAAKTDAGVKFWPQLSGPQSQRALRLPPFSVKDQGWGQ